MHLRKHRKRPRAFAVVLEKSRHKGMLLHWCIKNIKVIFQFCEVMRRNLLPLGRRFRLKDGGQWWNYVLHTARERIG
jgi:hypothetical protein